MADLSFTAVEKVYPNGYKAIHGIDLTVDDGQFVVLVGPSGCGKSTLLRMVAGLERISSGDIRIGGRVVNNLEPAERDIAMVFQNYALYPHMTNYANMAYGLKNRGTPKAEIERRVRETARILELEHLLDRKPRQLSGGQRQRVAMGRAIVREPAAFLFDEPLSNLDSKLRVQMRLEIRRLQKRLGTTSLYVTHDQVEAMTMADKLVVMNGGVAEQVGSPMEVYERPASLFVAGFIGSPAMNFLPARITEDGTGAQLDGGPVVPLNGQAKEVAPGQPVTVGLRPETLPVAESGRPHDLSLTVDLVEPLGADTLLHGRLEGTSHEITVRVPGTQRVAENAEVPLAFDPTTAHLFDPETGMRL